MRSSQVLKRLALSGEELARRQMSCGQTLEDLELILSPMAEMGKESVGSMGDDTPLAVLSDIYRPLSHYFRQNFSQVTNPPIDPLRETRVMGLKTRFRNLRNILAEAGRADERNAGSRQPRDDNGHVRTLRQTRR